MHIQSEKLPEMGHSTKHLVRAGSAKMYHKDGTFAVALDESILGHVWFYDEDGRMCGSARLGTLEGWEPVELD